MLLEAYLETKWAADLSRRVNGPHHPDTLHLQRAAELQKSAGNIQEELLKMIGEPAVLSGEVVTYKGRILHEDGCECIPALVYMQLIHRQWCKNVEFAVARNQKFVAYFFNLLLQRIGIDVEFRDVKEDFIHRFLSQDCVLFGRSTIFYVFLQKVSPEANAKTSKTFHAIGVALAKAQPCKSLLQGLSAKLRSPYDIDKAAGFGERDSYGHTEKLRHVAPMQEEWEGGLTQKVVNSILGEVHLYRHGGSESTLFIDEHTVFLNGCTCMDCPANPCQMRSIQARTDDPLERELARVYCNQLQSQNRDTQGTFMLRAFLQRAKRARLKVDEANDLTACIRPKSGLHFELASQVQALVLDQ
ncbi:CngA [Symbiodinium sp. CCMP2592]|nr:CngA [Symbiodinium sp. CCMP2592]